MLLASYAVHAKVSALFEPLRGPFTGSKVSFGDVCFLLNVMELDVDSLPCFLLHWDTVECQVCLQNDNQMNLLAF